MLQKLLFDFYSSARRYSPPQGSTGSSTKSPDITPKTSWDHGVPISTSSPVLQRKLLYGRPPYYVADTMNNSLDIPYLEHNLSNQSLGGQGFHHSHSHGLHSWHHPQDMGMVSCVFHTFFKHRNRSVRGEYFSQKLKLFRSDRGNFENFSKAFYIGF